MEVFHFTFFHPLSQSIETMSGKKLEKNMLLRKKNTSFLPLHNLVLQVKAKDLIAFKYKNLCISV